MAGGEATSSVGAVDRAPGSPRSPLALASR